MIIRSTNVIFPFHIYGTKGKQLWNELMSITKTLTYVNRKNIVALLITSLTLPQLLVQISRRHSQ